MEKTPARIWAPVKFYAGQLASCPGLAVLSCRYKNDVWSDLGCFTRATGGFKPGRQLDSSVELAKHVSGKVLELDNVPVAGFKLKLGEASVSMDSGMSYHNPELCNIRPFYEWARFVVEDPRGFSIGIEESELALVLEASGGKLDGWTIPVELAYVWPAKNSKPMLVPVSSAIWKEAWEASRKAESEAASRKFVKKEDLIPGKLYMAARTKKDLDSGSFQEAVFLGQTEVYSHLATSVAIRTGSYPDKAILQDHLDKAANPMSSAKIQCFRKRDFQVASNFVFASVSQNGTPFWMAKSISKLFPEDAQPEAKLQTPAPRRSSLEDSCVFQKLDLSKISREKLLDPKLLRTAVLASAATAVYDTWTFWNSKMTKEAWMEARSALSSCWPFYPCGFVQERSYPLSRSTAPFWTNRGSFVFRASQDDRHLSWILEASNPWNSSYGSRDPNPCWRASGTDMLELCSKAIQELQPEIPQLYLASGSKLPQAEAVWFSAEAIEYLKLDSFQWADL